MKINVKKIVEVEEEADIPDVGVFRIESMDQASPYGSISRDWFTVEMRLEGTLNREQMERLMDFMGKKVSVVKLA